MASRNLQSYSVLVLAYWLRGP